MMPANIRGIRVLPLLLALTACAALALLLPPPTPEARAQIAVPAPTKLSVTRSDGKLHVSWTSNQTVHHITYSFDNKENWELAAIHHTSTSIDIEADNSKTYYVAVRARDNNSNWSGWTNSSAIWPYEPPTPTLVPTPTPVDVVEKSIDVLVLYTSSMMNKTYSVSGGTGYSIALESARIRL